jgi:hypothetical protein
LYGAVTDPASIFLALQDLGNFTVFSVIFRLAAICFSAQAQPHH